MQDKRVAISSSLKLLYFVFLGISAFYLLQPNTGKGIVFLIATMMYRFLSNIIIEAIFIPRLLLVYIRFANIANLVQGFKVNRISGFNSKLELHQYVKTCLINVYCQAMRENQNEIMLSMTQEEFSLYRQWFEEL
jgi:cell division protein FtsW (lipid II flippase)